MKCQTVNINGHKLAIDLLNMNFLKRAIAAQDVMNAAAAAADAAFPGDEPYVQYQHAEAQIKAFCTFLDGVFGEGTSHRIFGDNSTSDVYVRAMNDFGRGFQRAQQAAQRRLSRR